LRRGFVTLLLFAVAVGGCADASGPADATDDHRPVVLIVVDTLRADHLGVYGYDERPTSPNIDRWAQRGLVFERAWATSPWTLPSFGSMLTGRLPTVHFAGIEVDADSGVAAGVVAARSLATLNEDTPSLAEVLQQQGFATGALVSNPLLDPRFGMGRGFADYDAFETDNTNLRPATETVDKALEWIDHNRDRPFFLMVHFFEPHMDYGAPAPFRGRFADAETGFELPVKGLWPMRNRVEEIGTEERDFIRAAYDEEIAYVDAEIGRFLDQLEQRAVLDEALVVLTSDHGEEFFEHGGFEHGHAMYDEVLRVPMILWGPQVASGREPMPVSLIDVMPTVLDAAGVTMAAGRVGETGEGSLGPLPGLSLLDAARPTWPLRRSLIAERLHYGPETKAIVSWPYKAILDIEAGSAKLFDLATDPAERDDLAGVRPAQLSELLTELSDQLIEAQAFGVATGAEIDEELLRRLRALGYIR